MRWPISPDRLASRFTMLDLELVAPNLAFFRRQVGEKPGCGGWRRRLLVSGARRVDAGALRPGLRAVVQLALDESVRVAS
jgi:hypothetical protein